MVITGNEAEFYGGGIAFYDSTGSLVISGSLITDNLAVQGGGGLYVNSDGAVTISGTTISGNISEDEGGGVHFYDTDLTIESSTISGNVAEGGGGGGVYVDNGSGYSFTMRNSTVSGNTASDYGGGLYSDGSATVENSTISGNTAGQAGGISTYGFLSLIQSTVTDNTATATEEPPVGGVQLDGGEVELIGTIVAGNDGEDVGSYEGTATATSTFSMIGTVGADITVDDVGGTQLGVSDPGLAPLAANGGPTKTHALLDGSVALNAGPDPVPSFPGNQFDQRGPGFARVAFGFVDVGAFEAQEDEPVVPPPSPDPGAAPADAVVAPKFTG